MKCEICHKEITGYDCNAWPLSKGRCCQECDDKYVVPLRIFLSGIVKDQILILKADNSIEYESVDKELSLKKSQDIVEGYIETAEPVSSGNLLKNSDLDCSSATIRNEMAELEKIGFLEKTHTSSRKSTITKRL